MVAHVQAGVRQARTDGAQVPIIALLHGKHRCKYLHQQLASVGKHVGGSAGLQLCPSGTEPGGACIILQAPQVQHCKRCKALSSAVPRQASGHSEAQDEAQGHDNCMHRVALTTFEGECKRC